MKFKGGKFSLEPRGHVLRKALAAVTLTAPVFFLGGSIVGGEIVKWWIMDRPGNQIDSRARTDQAYVDQYRRDAALHHKKVGRRTK